MAAAPSGPIAPGAASGDAGPRLATARANFGAGSKARSTTRVYLDLARHAPWRAAVYGAARAVAGDLPTWRVVDLACRDGRALRDAFGAHGVETVGVDFPHLLGDARERYPADTWIDADLADYDLLEHLYDRLAASEPRLYLLVDVLEHLDDPRPLLRTLRRLLLLDPASRAVVGTADRADPAALPPDDAHVREWSADEIARFLQACGFEIELAAPLPVDSDGGPSATLLLARCVRDEYEAFLRRHGLPPSDLGRVVFTALFPSADAPPRLVDATASTFGVDAGGSTAGRVGFCHLGSDPPPLPEGGYRIDPAALLPESPGRPEPMPELALRLAEQVVFLYHDLAALEYQDAGGVGLRIAQAKRSGLLPAPALTIARCLGTAVYREYETETWLGLRDVQVAHEEKVALELSDAALFPDDDRRRLYADLGYELDPNRVHVGTDVGVPAPPVATPPPPRDLTVTVVVPCYRTPLEYVAELIDGLNEQLRRPDAAVFVDDASGLEYADRLETLVAERLLVPSRLLRHETNRDVAAARNTGLAATTTDWVVFLDSDDIPTPDFVKRFLEYVARDPGVAAVTPYFAAFHEGEDWRDATLLHGSNPQIGDSVLLNHVRNLFGYANSAFDTRRLKEIGGWDDRDRAKSEDRALFMRLRSGGDRIGVIPRVTFLYRARAGSRARTRDPFAGQRKIARNVLGLDRFERLRLYGLLLDYRRLYQEHGRLAKEHRRLARRVAELEDARRELEQSRQASKRPNSRSPRVLDGVSTRINSFARSLLSPRR